MADVSEEAQVIAACSTLLAAAGLGAAAIKRKNERTRHGSKHTLEKENH